MSAVVVACVVMVATHLWTLRHWNSKMGEYRERLEGQRDAQYAQAKHSQKQTAIAQSRVSQVADDCARVLEDCRQLHGIAQDMVREVRGNG